MTDQQAIAPKLIFTYGNPSRGDDALGPVIFDLLEKHKLETGKLADVDLLTDFQLQIEHAVDLQHRQHVLFVDASVSCTAPYEVHRVQAERDDSFTTHAMSPSAVLAVYRQINTDEPPPVYLMSIRAYKFGLGREMSARANANLQQAFTHITAMKWGQNKAPD
jgi:hydrogenase maturation protease